MENISIETIKEFSPDLKDAINNLLVHLNPSSKQLSKEDVESMVNSRANKLIVAKDKESGKIVGMITLITYRIPFVKKGILEDFVVDPDFRGRGIGKFLITEAIDTARKEAVSYVDLTSLPEKEAANNLYQRLGFEKRDTNVYRVILQE